VWALAAPATADVWDVGPPGSNADNSLVSTLNVFAHGALQLHDLAGLTTPTTICPAPPCPDRDWYVVLSSAYTSHEVIIEAVSPNAAPGLAPPGLTRHDAAGTLLQQAQILGTGTIAPSATASLRWEGPGLGGVDYVAVAQVDPPSCGALCDSTAQYTLRYYETTGAIPRFNNSGGQVTVVILQNTSNDPPPTGIITGNINFFVGGSPTPVQVPFSIVETSASCSTVRPCRGWTARPAGSQSPITAGSDSWWGRPPPSSPHRVHVRHPMEYKPH
jgi:hypothetical protein